MSRPEIIVPFGEQILSLSREILEIIFKFLTVAEYKQIEEVINEPNKFHFLQRVITFEPKEVTITKDMVTCQKDQDGIEMTYEQFLDSNFKIVTPEVRFTDDISDKRLDQVMLEFRGRVQAKSLYVFDHVFFNADKFADFIQSIHAESLYIGGANDYSFLTHPIMKKIRSLRFGDMLGCSADFLVENNFETVYAMFGERISLEVFNQILKEWNDNKRVINDWQISGIIEPLENIYNLFGKWKVVDGINPANTENENIRPLVISTLWYIHGQALYKIISKDQRELFIMLKENDDQIGITTERPTESELDEDDVLANHLLDFDDDDIYDDYDDGDISLNSSNFDHYDDYFYDSDDSDNFFI